MRFVQEGRAANRNAPPSPDRGTWALPWLTSRTHFVSMSSRRMTNGYDGWPPAGEVVDANVLLYAVNSADPRRRPHLSARGPPRLICRAANRTPGRFLCETEAVPELPEVHGLAQALAAHATGRVVRAVHVTSFPALKTYDPPPTALVGATVTGVRRHGKWLDMVASSQDGERHLVFHLARAGWVRWHDAAPAKMPRAGKSGLAARVVLDEGAFDLTEAGTTKRLAIHVVRDVNDVEAIARLGVDPLSDEFTPELLDELLDAKNQQVKGMLRAQSVIAGIGNAYSDEILHAARLSPFALTRSLDAGARQRLFASIGEVLGVAIEAASGKEVGELKDVKRSGMSVHGRTGQPCPVCGDVIAEVSFADSSLQYCPTCQTGGKPLADRRMSKLLR